MNPVGAPEGVRGGVLEAGRCVHWHGPDDVLLLRLPCCEGFWACRACHDEAADHASRRWPVGSDALALQCGRCTSCFSIQTYLDHPDACPACAGAFNPRCRHHHDLYFDQHDS